jgi:ribosomal protein S18 acetylase RimI-like enzyme
MTAVDIVKLQASQITKACEVAAAAFADDPMFNYLIPDPKQRSKALAWFASRAIAYGLQYDRIYTTPEVQGMALWFPPGGFSSQIFQLLQMAWQLQLHTLPWQVGWGHLGRWLRVLAATEAAHQQDMGDSSHWYLGIMVVHPEAQGQGLGSRLLQPILQQASDEGLPCYLTTFTEQAVRFYQKNGFEVLHCQPITDTAPSFWTLKRDP